jgi:hypothetical protein
MTNTERLAERFARADKAFTRHVVDRVSLRDLVPEIGVSYETIRGDVAAFKQYQAESGGEELAVRRATFLLVLDDRERKALDVYDLAMAQGKPLVAIAAINTLSSLLTHRRAVEGLDMPREARVEQSGTITVVWDDGDTTSPQPND